MSDALAITPGAVADGVATLVLAGEVDLATAPALAAALARALAGAAELRVDLRGVTYLDSAGVDVLFAVAVRHPVTLVLADDSTVNAVVEVCGLSQVAEVESDAGGSR